MASTLVLDLNFAPFKSISPAVTALTKSSLRSLPLASLCLIPFQDQRLI